jgi:hypothetical protein
MYSFSRLSSHLGLSLAGILFLVGCGGAGGNAGGGNQGQTPASLTLVIDTTDLAVGESIPATVETADNLPSAVTWAVDGVVNGDASVGSISGSGTTITYTAPAVEGSHVLAATSTQDPARSASVQLKIRKATNSATVTLSPAASTVAASGTAAYQATVTGTDSQTITWFVDNVRNGNASAGTLSPNGNQTHVLYTAPSAAGVHTIKAVATNTAGAGASGSTTVTVQVAAQSPAIQSFSASPATITSGQGTILVWSTTGATQLSLAPTVGIVTGLSTQNVSPTLTTTYTLTARNAAGQTSTATTTVTVTPAPTSPTITSQPQGTAVTEGQTAAFSVTASSGTALSYQWRKNGSPISGATSRTYTTPMATVSDNGARFSAVVTNAAGTVTSSEALLTVTATSSKKWFGFGSLATGGDGYATIHVTNLNDSGSGSFRAAMGSNRTIVFDVGGQITLNSEVLGNNLVNLTIDGSTAPGPGITFLMHGIQFRSSHNIILTSFRHRGGDYGGGDSTGDGGNLVFFPDCYNVVVDRLSTSGYTDESIDFYDGSHDITIQNCIIGTASPGHTSLQYMVGNHSYNVTMYHNLAYLGGYRSPAVGWDTTGGSVATGIVGDVVNNLVWKYQSYGVTTYWGGKSNIVGNYFYTVAHPGESGRAVNFESNGQGYSNGNYSKDGSGVSGNTSTAFTVPAHAQITATSAAEGANFIKANAGCRVGGLDAYDQTVINDLAF